jgi:hypothetical protein
VVAAPSALLEEELRDAEGGGVVAVSIPNAEVVSDGVKKPFVVRAFPLMRSGSSACQWVVAQRVVGEAPTH